MKEQYVGDVNDYRKYALLRHFAIQGGLRIGVCWMLTLPDNGNLRRYLTDATKWRGYDCQLFDQLNRIIEQKLPSRLQAIEDGGTIPNARFFNAILTDKSDRRKYFADALAALGAAELLFFDPDNGIAPNANPKKASGSSKFITLDEIAGAYASSRSVLIYQHFPRVKRNLSSSRSAAETSRP